MITNEIEPGLAVRHIRSGNRYEVTGLTLMKIGTGPWVEGVNYTATSHLSEYKDFTRDIEFFRQNFELAN